MQQKTLWMVTAVEGIIEILNGTDLAKEISISLPDRTSASDELFRGFGKVCERELWCGSGRRLRLLFKESAAAGHFEKGDVIITYKWDEADLTKVRLSVPGLPFGEVAVLKSKLPKIRMASTSEETNPEPFFRGIRDLPWHELRHRFESSKATIAIQDLSRSVQGGYACTPLSEGMTHDYKCGANLSLDMQAFSDIAFRDNDDTRRVRKDTAQEYKPATLTRLLASVKVGAKAEAAEEEPPLHFDEGEACLLFGIPDKSNMILGHELMFKDLRLSTCRVFPPPLADEVTAEKIAVRIWPDNKLPSDLLLHVYTGNEDHYKVVTSEHGKAWRAGDKVLRIKPRSPLPGVSNKENDELPDFDCVPAEPDLWEDASIENYPIDTWMHRHLLRFVVRPQEDSKYIQGAFFDNAAGFLLPGDSSLSCLGVYFRLRPSRWQGRFSNGSGALRLEIGNCCGIERTELFDKRFETFTRKVMDELRSTVSSMRKSVAIEFSQVPAFLQAGLGKDPSIDVVMFVPLNMFQQIRTDYDCSRDQYQVIAYYCDQLSQFANLLDVVPAGFHELDPIAGTAPEDFSPTSYTEEQKKEIARRYYTCDAGEASSMLPQEMLRESGNWFVWTDPMRELLGKYEEAAVYPKSSSVVEVQSLLPKAGVTTVLSALRSRIVEKGGSALLFTTNDETAMVASVVATVEKTPGNTRPVAVLMDCPVADPQQLLENLKDRCKRAVFLVYHRLYRNGKLPVRIERARVMVSPLWSLTELECLIETLVRTFSGASSTCTKGNFRPMNDTALAKALYDLFDHAKDDVACRHVFLFVFVATTGVFRPLPELIKTARDSARRVGGRLRESPKRLFDAVAFVSATCPLGYGVPYAPQMFDSLLQDEEAAKVLVVKNKGRSGSSNDDLVRYVHPYFARIHLQQLAAETSGKDPACFDKPFPPPECLVSLWSTRSEIQPFCIRDDLKMLVDPCDYYDFFSPIFAQKSALSPLAEHFRQAKKSKELLRMCDGLIEPMHFDALESKLLRRESALHEGLKYFEEALDRACVSPNKGVPVTQQEMDVRAQMNKYFGDNVVFKSGSTKLREFLRELPECTAELDADEERVVSDEWQFLLQWSDT